MYVKSQDLFDGAEFILQHTSYPDVDVSEIHFYGTTTTAVLRMLYRRAVSSFLNRPVIRALTVGTSLLLLAPVVWLANTRAARRDTTIFTGVWTSSVIEFTVKRGRAAASGAQVRPGAPRYVFGALKQPRRHSLRAVRWRCTRVG